MYRSRTSTHGRNMAGARGLWRATGMKDSDFGKPIIAIVNSFTQFVPGHVHLKDLGQMVAREVEAAGGVAKEFNTIAVDDGIAMGHDGMLYSLPSREIIADSVEYMVNAHCADAMVCISNCDKITPGMLMASMRLNIPTIFVSGGPMEAGKAIIDGKEIALDLVDAMVAAADDKYTDEQVQQIEEAARFAQRIQAFYKHQRTDNAQKDNIAQLDQQIDLPLRLQVVEYHNTHCGPRQTADQQHRSHFEIDGFSPEMGQHAREGGRNNLIRLCRDSYSRWDADKEQKWRHQKAAANSKHT